MKKVVLLVILLLIPALVEAEATIRITNDTNEDFYPAIWGDNMVWEKAIDNQDSFSNFSIKLYNTESKNFRNIPYESNAILPDIYENYVVYQDRMLNPETNKYEPVISLYELH